MAPQSEHLFAPYPRGPLARWFGQPRRHGDVLDDRSVSPLELFYDLVFVVLIAQISHALAAHVTWTGIRDFVLEATRVVRERHTSVAVLVLTTYDTDEAIVRAVEAGAVGYMLKDSPTDDLVDAVRRAAAGESVLAPATGVPAGSGKQRQGVPIVGLDAACFLGLPFGAAVCRWALVIRVPLRHTNDPRSSGGGSFVFGCCRKALAVCATLKHMSEVGIRALKQNASAVVAEAAAGETVTITDRGRPVAQMTPIPKSRLRSLVDEGHARLPRSNLSDLTPPEPGPDMSSTLMEMRDSERY